MARFEEAVRCFDAAHQEDPKTVCVKGREVPWSVHYHERLAYWVERLAEEPSEALRLAAHCQHIRRWTIPRKGYPEGRAGYKNWRKTLARFHAQQADAILRSVGYEEATIARVKDLLQKVRLRLDAEVQLFEDAICLVFLENELADFAGRHEDGKVTEILQKTWEKMSGKGHQEALELVDTLPPDTRRLVKKALV